MQHTAPSYGRLLQSQAPALADDIDPGPDSSAPHDFVAFNGAVYFAAHDGTTPQAEPALGGDRFEHAARRLVHAGIHYRVQHRQLR